MASLVSVDDLVLVGNNLKAYTKFKKCLNNYFQIKDLGRLKYFLGIKVARNPKSLFLCPRKCVLEIIQACGLLCSKPVELLIEANHELALLMG